MLDALDNADWAEIERHPGLYETRQHYPMNKAAVPDSRHTIETQVNEGDLIASVCTVRGPSQARSLAHPPQVSR